MQMLRVVGLASVVTIAMCQTWHTISEGNWGSWGNPKDAARGYYACGMALRVEKEIGSGSKQDDTAANGLKI
jgi:hypothetical protein